MKTNQTQKKEVVKIYLNAGKSKKGNTYVAVKIVDVEGNESVHYINKTTTNKDGDVVAFDDEKKVFVKRKGEMILLYYDGKDYELMPNKYGWSWTKPIDTSQVDEVLAALGLSVHRDDDVDIISNSGNAVDDTDNEGEIDFDDILDF